MKPQLSDSADMQSSSQEVKAAWSVVSDITGPHSYLHQIACSGGKPVRGIRQEKDTNYQSEFPKHGPGERKLKWGKGRWRGDCPEGMLLSKQKWRWLGSGDEKRLMTLTGAGRGGLWKCQHAGFGASLREC